MNKQQVVYIHGGESFETDEKFLEYLHEYNLDISQLKNKSEKWNRHLDVALGGMFDVIEPQMPNYRHAKYDQWKLWFEKIVPQLKDDVVLVGNSLGSTFLLQYLAHVILPVRIKGLFLVAGARHEGDMQVPQNLENVKEQVDQIYLYHSQDDPVVSFADSEWIHEQLGISYLRNFDGVGHFAVKDIPELYQDIKQVAEKEWKDVAQEKKIFVIPVTGILTDVFFQKVQNSSKVLQEVLAEQGIYKSQAYLAEHYLRTAGKTSVSQFREAFEVLGVEQDKIAELTQKAEDEYRHRVLHLDQELLPGIKQVIVRIQEQGDQVIVMGISSEKEIKKIQDLLQGILDLVFMSKEGVLGGERVNFQKGEEQVQYIREHYVQDSELIVTFATAAVDVEKANNAGALSIAIPFASDRAVLEQAKPCFVMNTPSDIFNI